jgi:hypothetical protein
MRRITIATALVFPIVATIVGQALPLEGTWRANIAKSTYSPGPPPKTPGTIRWERVPSGWKFTTDGVNPQGQKIHTETLEKDDGTEASVTGSADPTTRASSGSAIASTKTATR